MKKILVFILSLVFLLCSTCQSVHALSITKNPTNYNFSPTDFTASSSNGGHHKQSNLKGIYTPSADCFDISSSASTPDAKTITWAGKKWDVIGINADGKTAGIAGPDGSVTIFLDKDNRDDTKTDFGNYDTGEDDYLGNTKRADVVEYSRSTMKMKLEAKYNALTSAQKSDLIPRTLKGGVTGDTKNPDSGNNGDNVFGADVPNQYFWPLSYNEATQLKASVRKFFPGSTSGSYWLRSPSEINDIPQTNSGRPNYMYMIDDSPAAAAGQGGFIDATRAANGATPNRQMASSAIIREAAYLSYQTYLGLGGQKTDKLGTCPLTAQVTLDGKVWDIVGINDNGTKSGIDFDEPANSAGLILSKRSASKYEFDNSVVIGKFNSAAADSTYNQSSIHAKMNSVATNFAQSANIISTDLTDVSVNNAKIWPINFNTQGKKLDFSTRVFTAGPEYWTRTSYNPTQSFTINKNGKNTNTYYFTVNSHQSTLRPAMFYKLTDEIKWYFENAEQGWNGLTYVPPKPSPSATDYTVSSTSTTANPVACTSTNTPVTCQGVYSGQTKQISISANSGFSSPSATYYTGTDGTTYAKSTTVPTDSGTYNISIDAPENNTYAKVTNLTIAKLSITKAALSVTADDKTVYQGDALPAASSLTYTAQGFVNNESATSAALQGSLKWKNTCNTTVTGTFANCIIEDSAFSAKNYSITFTAGNLTVSPKQTQSTLVLSGVPATAVTYGDNNNDYTLSTTGGSGNGQVTYEIVSGSASIQNSNHLKITGAGTIVVIAKKAGDSTYADTTSAQSSLTVNKYTTSITGLSADNKVYDGSTSTSISGNASMSVPSVDANLLNLSCGTSGAFQSVNVGNNIDVRESCTIGGINLDAYTISNWTRDGQTSNGYIGLKANITTKQLTVTGLSTKSKTYDGNTTVELDGTPGLDGVISGDTVSLSGNPTATTADKNAGTNINVTVTGYTLGGNAANNYTLPAGNQTKNQLKVTISAKQLSVTGLSTKSKTYDGNTTVELDGTPGLDGVISGDTVSLSGNPTATTADKNAGANKNVTVTGYTLAGSAVTNYTLPASPNNQTKDVLKVTINTKTIAGSCITGFNKPTKTYDGNTAVSITGTATVTKSASCLASNDTVTVSYSATGQFADSSVGTNKTVTITINGFAGTDGANYNAPSTTTTLGDIFDRQTLAVKNVTVSDKYYDGTTTATINTANAQLDGIDSAHPNVNLVKTGVTGVFADKNVGASKTVTTSGFSLSGADASYYALNQPTLSANINAKVLTITGLSTKSKTYDGNTTVELDGTPGLDGVISGDTVSVAGNPVATTADKNAGTNKNVTVTGYTLAGSAANNYTLPASPNNQTKDVLKVTINAKVLTITGLSTKSKTYDGNTTVELDGTPGLDGVISGETVSLSGNPTATAASKNVGTNINVTVTGYTLAGSAANNYTLPAGNQTKNQLKVTINAKQLSVTGLSAKSKTYDGNTTVELDGTPGLDGVISGETVSVAGNPVATTADKNAGTNKNVTVTGYTLGGNAANNYTLPASPNNQTKNQLKVTINAKQLSVTGLSAKSKTYDGNTTVELDGTPGLDGVISGETVSVAGNPVATTASKNVGTNINVTVTGYTLGGNDANNYTLPAGNQTKNQLKVTINTKTIAGSCITGFNKPAKTYDGNTAVSITGTATVTKSASCLASNDTVTVSYSATGQFADSSVGTNKTVTITINGFAGTDGANYNAPSTTTTLGDIFDRQTLIVKNVTVSTKTYDGTITATINTANAQLDGIDSAHPNVNLVKTGATGVFTDKNAGAGKTVTTSGFSLSGTDASYYALNQPTLSASINEKQLTVTGLSTKSKTYDGNTTVELDGTPGLDSVISGDTVSVAGNPVATTADKNAGTNKNVTVTGYTLAGSAANNYTLPASPNNQTKDVLKVTINAKVLTITDLSTKSKTYDGNTTVELDGTPGLDGVITGDAVSVAGNPVATTADKNAGANKNVTVTGYTLAGNAANNYTLPASPNNQTKDVLKVTINAKQLAVVATNVTISANSAMPSPQSLTWATQGLVTGDQKVAGSLKFATRSSDNQYDCNSVGDVGGNTLFKLGCIIENEAFSYGSNYDLTFLDGHLIVTGGNSVPTTTFGAISYDLDVQELSVQWNIDYPNLVNDYKLTVTRYLDNKVVYDAILNASTTSQIIDISAWYKNVYTISLDTNYGLSGKSTNAKMVIDLELDQTKTDNPFTDISALPSQRQRAIVWLYQHDITIGTTHKKNKNHPSQWVTYDPKNAVNRGAMAEFMRAVVGKPQMDKPSPSISDIAQLNDGRKEAIKWLASESITTLSGTKYNPSNKVNRGAMAEFLWNLTGKPQVSTSVINKWKSQITDVGKLAERRKSAIYWMAENGITKIGGDKKYNPNNPVNRGSMAEFLSNWYTNLKVR